jgi:hypothetical protein
VSLIIQSSQLSHSYSPLPSHFNGRQSHIPLVGFLPTLPLLLGCLTTGAILSSSPTVASAFLFRPHLVSPLSAIGDLHLRHAPTKVTWNTAYPRNQRPKYTTL